MGGGGAGKLRGGGRKIGRGRDPGKLVGGGGGEPGKLVGEKRTHEIGRGKIGRRDPGNLVGEKMTQEN